MYNVLKKHIKLLNVETIIVERILRALQNCNFYKMFLLDTYLNLEESCEIVICDIVLHDTNTNSDT